MEMGALPNVLLRKTSIALEETRIKRILAKNTSKPKLIRLIVRTKSLLFLIMKFKLLTLQNLICKFK